MSHHARSSQPLFIFPIIAGSVWFLVLSVLLIFWLSEGRPRLPSQIDPDIAFVSDIAALELKPFFVLCCSITAVSFVITIVAIHRARYGRYLDYGDTSRRLQLTSWLSVALSFLAAVCLVGLSLFDAINAGGAHAVFLNTALAAIGSCGVCVATVWWRLTGGAGDSSLLRTWCRVNCILIVCLVTLGLAFVACIASNHWFVGGILEWTITYLGAAWLFSFAGFLVDSPAAGDGPAEGRPLLS